MKVFTILLALLFMLPQFAGSAETPYSALIVDIEGNVLVEHGGKARPADLGELLYPGDVVETSQVAGITINYVESGREEQWPGSSKFSVGKTESEQTNAGVKVSNRKIDVPELQQGQTGAYTVRGRHEKREKPGD